MCVHLDGEMSMSTDINIIETLERKLEEKEALIDALKKELEKTADLIKQVDEALGDSNE